MDNEPRMKGRLIGVTGRAGHGKTSFAESIIVEAAERMADQPGTGWADGPDPRLAAFADPLKRAAMMIHGLDREQVYGGRKEEIDARWGMSARRILQRLGTDVAREVHPETWIRALFADIARTERDGSVWVWRGGCWMLDYACASGPRLWVVHDVRFPNEAEALRAAGGVIVRVARPEGPWETASEAAGDVIEPDFLVFNGGSRAALHAEAIRVLDAVTFPRPAGGSR